MPPKKRKALSEKAKRARRKHCLANESEAERSQRLSQLSNNHLRRLENESDDERSERLSQRRVQLPNETDAARARRLSQLSVNNQRRLENESDNERSERLSQRRVQLSNETDAARARRLSQLSVNNQRRLENESDDERSERLSLRRVRLSNETEDERRNRLEQMKARRLAQMREMRRHVTHIALQYHSDIIEDEVEEHYCGEMTEICEFCGAFHFAGERPPDKKFSTCCHKGKVDIPHVKVHPLLEDLMTMKHSDSKHFLDNIRKYNNALACASMGAQVKPPPGHGPYCFRVHGQVYHQSGPLHPLNGEPRKFAQLYILDPEEALQQRMGILANHGCKPELMNELGQLMSENNDFAKAYKMMYEVELEEKLNAEAEGRLIHEISMAIVSNRGQDPRRYNAPRVNEVAIVFSSADGAPPFDRDIRVSLRGEHRTKKIDILHAGLDPMTYPLLFPYGDWGWNDKIQQVGSDRKVTQLQYYSHRLAVRDEFNAILSAGKLTQQYCVDTYCKIEANRLHFIELHQDKLRTEKYNVLKNLCEKGAQQGKRIGKQCILPSSFPGSPRNMNRNYQDAMAICRKFTKPDLFMTMTMNAKIKEVIENLKSWQRAEFRPDLIARVFHLKLKELMNDITKKHILGVPVAKIHVIEFQKRGLPHAHILIFLREEDKPKTGEIIDKFVSAEIPDPVMQPKLHKLVMKHMIHGPCGAENPNSPCMGENGCTKKFPKPFCNVTNPNVNGYPLYRRPNTGVKFPIGSRSVDNSWVVPYNPYLLLKYNCHINLEICSSIQSVKYLFKYVYKGHDCATVEVRRSDGTDTLEHNEVESYIDSRYVSAPESIWRIFEYKMHDQSHAVYKLDVYLPNEHPVRFAEGDEIEALEAQDGCNTLTAYFKLNEEDANAHRYHYIDIPEHYVYDKKEKYWKPRQRGGDKVIGRMYNFSVAQGELFYLRLLLLHVRGASSYEALRTVNGELCESYKAAAIKLGLLEDDTEWDNCLSEASDVKMPFKLRELFAFICAYCEPKNGKALWEKYKKYFIEDFVHRGMAEADAEHYALHDVQSTLLANGKNLRSCFLPEPPDNLPPLPTERMNYEHESELGAELVDKLNVLQKEAYDRVMKAVENNNHKERLFFLDGPGGSGKTFTYDTLYHAVSGLRLNVTACASTGIAANLLPFGRTYHSTFGLGPTFDKTKLSKITPESEAGKALRATKIIVWDEITMTPFFTLDEVDRLLRDCCYNNKPFGGKVILLGGDFRQCLPIVKHGSRVKIVEACIQSSRLWEKFVPLKLEMNMRVQDNNDEFRSWLLKLGNGELTNTDGFPEDTIEIPPEFVETGDIIDSIYGKQLFPNDVEKFQNKAILCPKNKEVHKLNNDILKRLDGESRTYCSADSIVTDVTNDTGANPVDYPTEFLNSLLPSGTPPHKLTLKKGAIIMLLRNLNTNRGLCNGTRLIVDRMENNLIIAKVLTGKAKDQIVFIPRIDIIPSDADIPFQLRRRQFPVMLAFAMTINKSQGQSLDAVGIYLENSVFSHGQLYVAFSRAKSKANIKVRVLKTQSQGKLIPGSDRVFTKNIVYKEVFDGSTARERYENRLLVEELEDYELEQAMLAMSEECPIVERMFEEIELDDENIPEEDDENIPEEDDEIVVLEDPIVEPTVDHVVIDNQFPSTSRGSSRRSTPPATHNMGLYRHLYGDSDSD